MRRSRKPFGLYKVTRVRIPPPPPACSLYKPRSGYPSGVCFFHYAKSSLPAPSPYLTFRNAIVRCSSSCFISCHLIRFRLFYTECRPPKGHFRNKQLDSYKAARMSKSRTPTAPRKTLCPDASGRVRTQRLAFTTENGVYLCSQWTGVNISLHPGWRDFLFPWQPLLRQAFAIFDFLRVSTSLESFTNSPRTHEANCRPVNLSVKRYRTKRCGTFMALYSPGKYLLALSCHAGGRRPLIHKDEPVAAQGSQRKSYDEPHNR